MRLAETRIRKVLTYLIRLSSSDYYSGHRMPLLPWSGLWFQRGIISFSWCEQTWQVCCRWVRTTSSRLLVQMGRCSPDNWHPKHLVLQAQLVPVSILQSELASLGHACLHIVLRCLMSLLRCFHPEIEMLFGWTGLYGHVEWGKPLFQWGTRWNETRWWDDPDVNATGIRSQPKRKGIGPFLWFLLPGRAPHAMLF